MKKLYCWALVVCMAGPVAGQGFGWRGDGSGRFPAATPPTRWNIDERAGICWSTVVGRGASSPVITAQKSFITAEPSLLVCLDRNGKVSWQRDDAIASLPPAIQPPQKRATAHPDCGYATATPVVDGQFVYASYGTGVIACHDLEGKRQWVRLFDQRQELQYGRTASPLLVGDVLLVTVNHLMALRRQTGETLWEAHDAKAAYGTPAAARIGNIDVVFTPHGECVRVSDGRVLAKKLCKLDYASPVIHGGTIYFVGQEIFAAQLPAAGAEQIKLERLWESDDLDGKFYSSPVYHEGILYCVSNEGNFYALDAKTGKLIYCQELDIASASGKSGGPSANLYASVTLVGHYLVVCNDTGESLVILPGRQFQKVSRNLVDKGSGASPVADGQLLLVRGGLKLYGLGSATSRQP